MTLPTPPPASTLFPEPSTQLYAQVVFNMPVPQTFTYEIPAHLRELIQPGMRAHVPFGSGRQTGYVVGLTGECDPGLNLKPLLDLPDGEPLLSAHLLELTHWVAEYYQASWGEVIRAALPGGLEEDPPEVYHLTGLGEEVRDQGTRPAAQRLILEILAQKGKLTSKQLRRRLRSGFQGQALAALRQGGWVAASYPGARSTAQYRLEKIAVLVPDIEPEDAARRLARSPRQSQLHALLRDRARPLSELAREMPGYAPLLRRLRDKGLVEVRSLKTDRGCGLLKVEAGTEPPLKLTPDQARIFSALEASLERGRFQTILLHGITGSGKTELYLRCIQKVLDAGKTAIMLVPEISLTPQTVHRFRLRFGSRVAVLHSGLNPIERYREWRRIREGAVSITVGARSAVFAPFENLGAVIVDEEHDGSYKQDAAPRYHARDTAIVRARMAGAAAVLGSATPSLESRHNAAIGKYTYLHLPRRVGNRLLPLVRFVDMRLERGRKKNFSILSVELKRAIWRRLEQKEQVFLFLNRRGTANYIVCQDCGFVFECARCSVSLTFHGHDRRLRCHYCNFTRPEPAACAECGADVIRFSGFGTQKLEEETQRLFPQARCARLDRDTVRTRAAFDDMFENMRRGRTDILIGTQMITKGHDFPNVTLVGVIAADMSLHIPDFRSGERTFQLLTQVAGRAGRGRVPGEVIIQAHQLEHEVYGFVRRHDYEGFYQWELDLRRRLHFPPFSRLAVVEVEGDTEAAAETACQNVHQHLRESLAHHPGVELLGPAHAALYRLKDRFRWHLILRAAELNELQGVLRPLQEDTGFRRLAGGNTKIIIDVDPVNLL